MADKFISEKIYPDKTTFDTKRMSAGEPGVPGKFRWRDQTVAVTGVLKSWRTTTPCRHGSGEHYARKHWFEITTKDHGTMKIYFDKGRLGDRKDMGWRLFSLMG